MYKVPAGNKAHLKSVRTYESNILRKNMLKLKMYVHMCVLFQESSQICKYNKSLWICNL
jgi:hypothetical protein